MSDWTFHNKRFAYEAFAPHIIPHSAWLGHRQFAYDLVMFMKPNTIVELGTHGGASFFSFCEAVKDGCLQTKCYAIDTWEGDGHTGTYNESIYHDVQHITTNLFPNIATLKQMTFDEALSDFEAETINLLHIDGFHHYEAVKHDYETWLPKLAPKAIVLFHDIAITIPGFGVWKLWSELKTKFPSLEFFHSAGLGVLFPAGIHPQYEQLLQQSATFQKQYSSAC